MSSCRVFTINSFFCPSRTLGACDGIFGSSRVCFGLSRSLRPSSLLGGPGYIAITRPQNCTDNPNITRPTLLKGLEVAYKYSYGLCITTPHLQVRAPLGYRIVGPLHAEGISQPLPELPFLLCGSTLEAITCFLFG